VTNPVSLPFSYWRRKL